MAPPAYRLHPIRRTNTESVASGPESSRDADLAGVAGITFGVLSAVVLAVIIFLWVKSRNAKIQSAQNTSNPSTDRTAKRATKYPTAKAPVEEIEMPERAHQPAQAQQPHHVTHTQQSPAPLPVDHEGIEQAQRSHFEWEKVDWKRAVEVGKFVAKFAGKQKAAKGKPTGERVKDGFHGIDEAVKLWQGKK